MEVLGKQLEMLKPHLAKVAQDVFESWDFSQGGACDEIALEMTSVVYSFLPHVTVLDGGQEGDDHAWLVVLDGMSVYGLDIPWQYYERQIAFYWYEPLEGVVIDETMVTVWELPNKVEDFYEMW